MLIGEKMTVHYKLVRGPDNITWCSLEPLLRDLEEQYQVQQLEHVRQHLHTVITFVRSLLQESELAGLQQDATTH
jgi:hypothetical protein